MGAEHFHLRRERRAMAKSAARWMCWALALWAMAPPSGVVAQTPGPNINMVSGTRLPDGDPFLQRQNEPSMAVSTRNPCHLLAGANDYRTVDMPGLPGDLENGDAWLGLFKSFDCGQTWRSALIHGFPQDTSPEGLGSPLKGLAAAADPMVRAGTHGLFYYGGLAFNRGTQAASKTFVARFIDRNVKVKDAAGQPKDSIEYLGTSVIDAGTSGQFADKPSIAVDVPRANAPMCRIGTESIPAGTVYAVYTVFLGQLANSTTRLMVSRSTDCGTTWQAPVKISEGVKTNQGAAIAVAPDGTVYVVWRQFASTGQPNAILVSRSTDGGRTFSKGASIAQIAPFDQGTSTASFRTNAYPAVAIDGTNRVYVAWSARGKAIARPDPVTGDARIVMSTSPNGVVWSTPFAIDNAAGRQGHQIMPALTVAAGRLQLIYYDLRDDHSFLRYLFGPTADGGGYTYPGARVEAYDTPDTPATVFWQWVADLAPDGSPLRRRHTIDVRGAQAVPADVPAFSSWPISQYAFGVFGTSPDSYIEQLQFNPPNVPLYAKGTAPFFGDYIDIAAQNFVAGPDGTWRFNTDAVGQDGKRAPAVFHAVWTDNRDVRPPTTGKTWADYTPPTFAQGDWPPNAQRPVCNPGATGMRNANIYTSQILPSLVLSSPDNAKSLDRKLPSAFPVVVTNASALIKYYRLRIASQPPGADPDAPGFASFLELLPPLPAVVQIDVKVPAMSSAARTVFVRSSQPDAQVTVFIQEIDSTGSLLAGGDQGSLTLNSDRTNPAITNPAITNPAITNQLFNPAITNPAITNPAITNPAITNPAITNPAITNPAITNPAITNGAITDVTWTITNTGTASGAFTTKMLLKQSLPAGLIKQLIVHKSYVTPTALDSCEVGQSNQDIVIANILNPAITNPAITNPAITNPAITNPAITNPAITNPAITNPAITNPAITNPAITNTALDDATFALAPGEQVKVTLRIVNSNKSTNQTMQVLNPGALEPTTVSVPAGLVEATPDSAGNAVLAVTPTAVSQALNVETGPGGVPTLQLQPAAATAQDWLLFVEQPSPVKAGAPITPPVTVRVLGAAGPIAGVAVTLSLVPSGATGTIGGTLTVTTDASGTATFADVRISDAGMGYQLRATATSPSAMTATSLLFNVQAVAALPSAFLSRSTNSGQALVLSDLLAVQPNPNGDALTITAAVLGLPAHGTVTFTPSMAVYTPTPNYSGSDTLYYVVRDTHGQSATSVVYITVNSVNHAPTFVVGLNQTVAKNAGPQTVPNWATYISAGSPDEAGQSLTFEVTTNLRALFTVQPAISAGGTLTYTPTSTGTGTATLTVVLRDNGGTLNGGIDTSAAQYAAISLQAPKNAPPVAGNDTATTLENVAATIDVRANDSDPDGDPLTVSAVSTPLHGTATIVTGGTAVSYLPALNYPSPSNSGTDTFTYTVSDGKGGTATATVTVTVTHVNQPPVATAQIVNTAEDVAAAITLTGTDVDGNPLTYAVATPPSHGTLLGTAPTLTYTPALNYSGPDGFSFRVSDGPFTSVPATVTITVYPVNDAPVALADGYATNQNIALTLAAPGVLGNDTDIDSPSLTAHLVQGPTHGAVTLNPDGSFIFTPEQNFAGVESFTYQASDGALDATARVTITVNATGSPTFVVTNTNDGGPGSLRQAMETANTTPGLDTITFSISGAGPYTIVPMSQLPPLSEAVIIDGSSQPGAAPGAPTIELAGNGSGPGAGLTLLATAGGSTVRGLAINRFAGGINVQGDGNTIAGNFIGTDVTGTTALANDGDGILIWGGSNNTIGGAAAAERNVISGNRYGMSVHPNGAGGLNNVVQGNYIGTDKTGTLPVGNLTHGLNLEGAEGTRVVGNVISGNLQNGLLIIVGANHNVVQGNKIGTDVSGTHPLGNTGNGILLDASSSNVIGGTANGEGNIVSGNAANGIALGGSGTSTANQLLGNLIGTDVSGAVAIPNSAAGVFLMAGTTSTTIGGDAADAGNVISGNLGGGLNLVSAGSNTFIQGNLIGVNASGTAVVANVNSGISVQDTPFLTIGGTVPAARNIISGNTGNGISLNGAVTTTARIEGNYIGVLADGTTAGGNGTGGSGSGVIVASGAQNTGIGGGVIGARNVISGNRSGGVNLTAAGAGTFVQGNLIGLNAAGTAVVANASSGVSVLNTPFVTIGGTAALERNIISGNSGAGVYLSGAGTNTVFVQGNYVGTDVTGSVAIPNHSTGITISGASGNVVGGTSAGSGNLVSGNVSSGIYINGATATGNTVAGNLVGTDASGTLALPNSNAGVQILGGSNNIIGGATPQARNLVSGGALSGVSLRFGATNNFVQGNYIGTNLAGTGPLGNGGAGVIIGESSNNTVVDNVISGNNQGVLFVSQYAPWTATGNVISRNKIGTNADGTAPIPNTWQGVNVAAPNPSQPLAFNKASNNTIGGATAGDGNIISGNTGGGVVLQDGTGNAVLSNTVVSNSGFGIDLGGNGVTPNDALDADVGANNLQNFPVLAQVLSSPTATRIQGTLGSTPSTAFTLQFFSNTACSPSGYGQGEQFIGTAVVTTDVSGSADFTADFGVSTPAGRVITSTATDSSGNTSEFSACRSVVIVSDVTEPNDTALTAAVLPMGTTANLLYVDTGSGDPDWYKFYVPPEAAGQDLRVNVRVTSMYLSPTPTGYYSDIDFELFDGTQRALGIALSGSDNESIYLHNVTSGWYYISVPYCTTNYADGPGIARYAVTLETGTNFGVGYVAGRVVDGEEHGIGGVFVRASSVPYDHNVSFPIMTTAPDGTFTIAHTPAVRDLYFTGHNPLDFTFTQPAVNVVNEYFRDKTSAAAADHLTVSAEQTVDVGDVVLETGAIVSGRVTNPSGVGVYLASIASYDVGGTVTGLSARTDTNGDYTLVGVPVGGALLRVTGGAFAAEYYDDQPTPGSATVLPTQSGQTLSGINIQLGPGGTITGSVKNTAEAGIAVNVRLYSVLDSTFPRSSVTSASSTGNFTFSGVFPGTYVIQFNAAGTSYASEWYGDAASFALATPITVTAGVTTSGINAQLADIIVVDPLIITTLSLPDATAGQSYSQGLSVSGGAPVTWSLPTGSLPPGLSLTSAGTITGTVSPAASGAYSFTVRAHPSSGADADRNLTISVIVPSGLTVLDATTIRLWPTAAVNSRHMAVFPDGTLLAETAANAVSYRIDAATGGVSGASSTGIQPNAIIWAQDSSTGFVIGNWNSWTLYSQSRELQWSTDVANRWGCCNLTGMPNHALDGGRNRLYVTHGLDRLLTWIDLLTGVDHTVVAGGNAAGMVTIDTGSNVAFIAGKSTAISRWDISGTLPAYSWQVFPISSGNSGWTFSEGAISAAGDFVVTTTGNHAGNNWETTGVWTTGWLVRVASDGSYWNQSAQATTPAVIGQADRIFIGAVEVAGTPQTLLDAPGVVRAYDTAGNILWSAPTLGLPQDLFVGDDGNVYVLCGGTTEGRIIALSQATGALKVSIEHVPAPWEMVLRNGVIYVNGPDGVTAVSLSSPFAYNYDSLAPWPVRQHDNQRTSAR